MTALLESVNLAEFDPGAWRGPDIAEKLQYLWNEKGIDATAIAGIYGVTRNAVLGKIDRLRAGGMVFDARTSRRPRVRLLLSSKPKPAPRERMPALVTRKPTVERAIGLDDPARASADEPQVRAVVQLPSYNPERVAARRKLELILDERTLYRTDTIRCVCGKPGRPHCAKHAAIVARVLG